LAAFETIDIHGMTKEQGKAAIDARLKRCRGDVYTLRVVHGFHGGTALREMVRNRYKKHPKVIRIQLGLNPGETDLILKEF
jgi:Uncharacterized protein conserved in bacteria